MVFHRSLSDRKSSRISRTRHSILVDLSNAIVCIVSARSLISSSSTPHNKYLRIVPSAQIIIDITVTFIVHNFLVLRQGPSTCLSFSFLLFSLCGSPGQQSPLFGRFSIFLTLLPGLVFWPGLGDLFISQVPGQFLCFILQEGFWFV